MKKGLLILLCLPLIGFGQCISGNCNNGYGTYTWNDEGKYVGEWRNGNRTGQGTYTWPSGNKYVGEYKDMKRHGQGTLYWKSKSQMFNNIPAETTYIGQWMDDKMHGQGTATFVDGTVKDGSWENGEFIK